MNLSKIFLFLSITSIVGGISWYYYRATEPRRIIQQLEKLDLYTVGKSEKLADRLVEVVGPENAISRLNEAKIPSGGVKHFVSHEVGASMYRRFGTGSIVYCNDDGLNGCLHGLIIESVGEIGFEGVAEMIKNCRSTSARAYKMCVHGAGHAFLALANYKVDEAIKLCDKLSESIDDDKTEIVRWCGSGLFMENSHGDHNGLIPPLHPSLSQTDIMSPCSTVKTEYRGTCYLNQAGWWHQINGSDITKTLANCKDVPEEYRHECADNISRLINTTYPDNVQILEKYCRKLGEPWGNYCIEAAAKSYIFVGNFSDISLEICKLNQDSKACFDKLYEEAKWQGIKSQQTKEWCEKFNEKRQYDCSVF